MTQLCSIRAAAAALIFVAALCFSSLSAHAQGNEQQPPPAPAPTPALQIGRSHSLATQVQLLGERAHVMMPALSNQMMRLKGWIEYWSYIVMLLITLGSALREWHENNGEGRNLFWWFGRFAVCLMLWGSGTAIIDTLYVVGRDIAGDSRDTDARSRLYDFYLDQQDRFNQSYNKILNGHLTVKVKGEDEFAVQPIDGTEKILGVMYDQGSTIKDIQNKLNDSSYSLPMMFGLMSFARGMMEVGDVWLVVLAGLLVMAFKALAPLMIALAVDRKLSQRAVHGYVWGLIVLTLFWPSVSYFLRALAYLAGNFSMAVWDEDQVYAWNPTTLAALRDPFAQPTITIAFSALMMLGAAFALIVSPYFAYAFSMGRVFETISQHATQTASSFVGMAAEAWSSLVGSHVSRQAEGVQIEGGFASEGVRAKGELDSAGFSIEGRQYRELAGVNAGKVERLGELYAREANTIAGIKASLAKEKDGAFKHSEFERRNQMAGAEREQKDMRASAEQQWGMMQGGALTSVISAGGNIGYMLGGGGGGQGVPLPGGAGGPGIPLPPGAGGPGIPLPPGASGPGIPLPPGVGGPGAGGAAGPIGPAIAMTAQVAGPAVGLWWQKGALEKGFEQHLNNFKGYTKAIGDSRNTYLQDSYKVSEDYAKAMEGATYAYTGHTAGAINSGAVIQRDGINRGAEMELRGADVRYEAQMDAARISRDAAIGAVNMRAMGQVWSSVMSRVARDIEKSMEMRF